MMKIILKSELYNNYIRKKLCLFSKRFCLIIPLFIGVNCLAFDFDYDKQIYKVKKDTREVSLIKGQNAPDVVVPARVFDEDDRGYRVVAVSDKAYYNYDAIRSISFEGNIQEFGENVFTGCNNLTEVYMSTVPAKFSENSFSKSKPILFIPHGSIGKYEKADYEKYFSQIKEVAKGQKPILLTVKNAEPVKSKIKPVPSYVCYILPETGWVINTVTHNGKNITDKIDSENRFVSPSVSINAKFRASFEKRNDSRIKDAEDIKVYASGSNIVIKNLNPRDMVTVCTPTERLVKKFRANKTEATVSVNPEITSYIVKVNERIFKVML